MLRIAVTGGIACGKSLVGALFAEAAAVRDADEIAHAVMQPDGPVYQRVVDSFGRGILADDGRIDRGRLGGIVFADEAARSRLNTLVHPAVKAVCARWLADREADSRMAVVLAPLLFEADMAAGWDGVVCVACSEGVQMARLEARGLSESESRRRVAAQMELRRKMELSDYVIFNDGTLTMLKEQTRRVIECIRKN